MSLAAAAVEVRERFLEASAVLSHLRSIAPEDFQPLDDTQKSLRALYLVAIYAAVERSANAIVEAALVELTSHGAASSEYISSLLGILHFAKLKSLRDCSRDTIFDKSTELFSSALSDNPASFMENPLANKMQNVDGGTLEWICSLFGVVEFSCKASNKGRLGNLRERRNAVAHGRESSSSVGGRFTLEELANIYDAADEEITRFMIVIQSQCDDKLYKRRAA
jgi:hypothetical protein